VEAGGLKRLCLIHAGLSVGIYLGLALLSGCVMPPLQAQSTGEWSVIQTGVTYAKRVPVADSVVHVVRVDLKLNRLEVSGPQEKGQTVDAMTETLRSVVSVNASFFDRSYQPRGITISNGQAWAPVLAQQQSPLLACDGEQNCHIQLKPPFEARSGWHNVVAGTPWLLDHGKPRSAQDDAQCKSLCESAHPRTAVGLDISRRYLYLVTVEGRRPPVQGLSLTQLSAIMASLGIADAINLDGGGSSALFIHGVSVMLRPAHEPAHRKVANAIHIAPRSPSP